MKGVGEGELSSEEGRADGPQGDGGESSAGAKANPRYNVTEYFQGVGRGVGRYLRAPRSSRVTIFHMLQRADDSYRSVKLVKATYDRNRRPPIK